MRLELESHQVREVLVQEWAMVEVLDESASVAEASDVGMLSPGSTITHVPFHDLVDDGQSFL